MSGTLIYRYSEAFKLQVVSEIEAGKSSIDGVRRRFGIGGGGTISRWLRDYGKNHLLGKVVRVEKLEERDRVRELEKKIRRARAEMGQL